MIALEAYLTYMSIFTFTILIFGGGGDRLKERKLDLWYYLLETFLRWWWLG